MTEGDLLDKVTLLFKKNRRFAGEFQYTVPSPNRYPYQWMWDSCFHAMIMSRFDTEGAKAELRSLFAKQFDDGFLPHVIYWKAGDVLSVDWGVEGTSSITQPPIAAEAVQHICQQEGNNEFFEELLPNLERLYAYIHTRRHPKRGVLGIINPDESGEDTSPRFDEAQGLAPEHTPAESFLRRKRLFDKHRDCGFRALECTSEGFWVEDTAFNIHTLRNIEAMASMATASGFDEVAARYTAFADELRESIRTHLFHKGLIRSFYGFEKRHVVSARTWALFLPLASGLLSEDEARRTIEEHLLNIEEFWTRFPVPTTAVTDPAFDPLHAEQSPGHSGPNWRGPIWMAPNLYIHQGLLRYGYTKEAAHLRDQSIELLRRSGFREYYDPLSGDGYGATDFTWGGLVLLMEQ